MVLRYLAPQIKRFEWRNNSFVITNKLGQLYAYVIAAVHPRWREYNPVLKAIRSLLRWGHRTQKKGILRRR